MSELLQEQVAEVERLLSEPEQTPGEFKGWVVYWLVANMDISTYQIRGLSSTFFRVAPIVAENEYTADFTMGDLPTVGPTLEELENGTYLAFWGANVQSGGGDVGGLMGISASGQPAHDSYAAKGRTFDDSDNIPIIFSRVFTLSGGLNTLQAKYAREVGSEGAPYFWNRWLAVVKVGRDV